MFKRNMQSGKFEGRVAIVTGASSGIGAAIAKKLVENGAKVVGLARRIDLMEETAKKLDETKSPGKLYPFKADVTKEQDILKAFQWVSENLSPVSILVNNAGIMPSGNLIDGSTEMFQKIFGTNVVAMCVTAREAIKMMRQNGVDGHIVNINSIVGHTVLNLPSLNAYPASKFAIGAITETLRHELARLGSKIRVTSLSPGGVESEMTVYNPKNTPERQAALANYPFLKADNVADCILYVLSTPENVLINELMVRPVGDPF